MTYQLGSIINWTDLKEAIANKDFNKAADEVLLNKDKTKPSLLVEQTPQRAYYYANTLRSLAEQLQPNTQTKPPYKPGTPTLNLEKKKSEKPAVKKEVQKEQIIDINNDDEISNFLNASVSDKAEIIKNGLSKKSQEVKAKLETNIDALVDNLMYDIGKKSLHYANMPTTKDIENIKKEATTRVRKKQAAKRAEIKLKNQKEADSFINNLPTEKPNEVYNLKKLSFGARNRYEYPETNSSGVVVQTLNPIIKGKPKFTKGRQTIVLNNKTGKLEFPNSEKDLSKDGDYSYTIQNKWENIKDFDIFDKEYDNKNGTGTFFPKLIDSKNKKHIYQVGAKQNDNSLYQGLYGGKMLLISEDGRNQMLYVGSIQTLKKHFDEFKDKTHSNTVSVVQLDQGSFNKPHIPKNNKMSKADWKSYENHNVSGGHAFYIKK